MLASSLALGLRGAAVDGTILGLAHQSIATPKDMMMTNPFDDADGSFMVLVNDEEQYSLWPAFAAVPAGWSVALEETTREECMQFITLTWKDLRPKSLRESMELDVPKFNN